MTPPERESLDIEKYADYDWNSHAENPFQIPAKLIYQKGKLLIAEDLRDGLGGVGIYPNEEAMLAYVESLRKLGIDQMTVGIFPGFRNDIDTTIKNLLSGMAKNYPDMTPIVLSLTTKDSLNWTGECVKLNPKLKAIVFRGTAKFRMFVEGEKWNEGDILSDMRYHISETVKQGVQVIAATEHTTQTDPEFLRKIIKVAVESGATEFCIADTIGIADEAAAYNIVRFAREELHNLNADNVILHWHGHEDMGNGLGNAKAALLAGADKIHTVPMNVGERAGNTGMEGIILNLHTILKKGGFKSPWNMSELWNVLIAYSKLTETQVPSHGPMSLNSTDSQLGIHAAAMLKALLLAEKARADGNIKLASILETRARTVYTSVDPNLVGKKPNIKVGPLSGASNVKVFAILEGLKEPTEKAICTVLKKAKTKRRTLTPEEIKKILKRFS